MTAGSPDHDRTMHAALAAEASSVTRSVPVIRLVADLVCPWCYIAFNRLQRTLAGSPALLIWHPFLLNPNLPAHGVTRRSPTSKARCATVSVIHRWAP